MCVSERQIERETNTITSRARCSHCFVETNFLLLLRNLALRGKPILRKVWRDFGFLRAIVQKWHHKSKQPFISPPSLLAKLKCRYFYFTCKQIFLKHFTDKQTDTNSLTQNKRQDACRRRNKRVKKKTTKSKTAKRSITFLIIFNEV